MIDPPGQGKRDGGARGISLAGVGTFRNNDTGLARGTRRARQVSTGSDDAMRAVWQPASRNPRMQEIDAQPAPDRPKLHVEGVSSRRARSMDGSFARSAIGQICPGGDAETASDQGKAKPPWIEAPRGFLG